MRPDGIVPDQAVRTVVDGHTLTLSNLDKVLYPVAHVTKAEVIDYYVRIAPTILTHLAGRCPTRVRFPNGVDGGSFYEKNAPSGSPDWIPVAAVATSEGTLSYPLLTESAALVYLANLASLEFHAPQWTLDHVTFDDEGSVILEGPQEPRATTLVVDLDPGPGVTMVHLAHAAMIIATRLAHDQVIALVKTSGSKGLQLSAPIAPTPSEQVVDYVRRVGAELVERHPDRFTITMAKAARPQRIFLDYLQNKASRNTVVAYSLRAREHPWVATPLTWDEIADVTESAPLRFTPDAVLARVHEHGDLMADILAGDGPELPPRP